MLFSKLLIAALATFALPRVDADDQRPVAATTYTSPCHDTADAAGVAAVRAILGTSIAENVEYAGRIALSGGGTCYEYSTPNRGSHKNSDPGEKHPEYNFGFYHTHGAPKSGSEAETDERFSPEDLAKCDGERSVCYLGTPRQNILKFTPCSVERFAGCYEGGVLGRTVLVETAPVRIEADQSGSDQGEDGE